MDLLLFLRILLKIQEFFFIECLFSAAYDLYVLEALKLLGLSRATTFSFPTAASFLMLYFTLLTSRLECTSVAGNTLTPTEASNLELIHRKFQSLVSRSFLY